MSTRRTPSPDNTLVSVPTAALSTDEKNWEPVRFKGLIVSRSSILDAIATFDASYPDTNQYENWLDKGSYKFALKYRGKIYPCKHILSQATAVSTTNFSGGSQTNSVFEHLGFIIISKEERDNELQSLELTNSDEVTIPGEIETIDAKRFREGAVKQVYVNRYERDQRARQICIERYGYVCAICAFDFEEQYGPVGAEFIHVHHLRPLAEAGEAYELDPVHDLLPVCPNCHAMIHRHTPAYSVQEVQAFMATARQRSV